MDVRPEVVLALLAVHQLADSIHVPVALLVSVVGLIR